MNKNYKYKVIGIFAVCLFLLVVGSMYYINSSSANTITVYKETVEEKITKEGIITSNQTLIYATSDGEALFNCQEGKLITPYVKIATVYSGDIDEETKESLRGLNDKIVFAQANEKSAKNIIGDISSISRDINNTISDVITKTNENNYEDVYKAKNEITAYNKKLMQLKGQKVEEYTENIENEIAKVEGSLNASKQIYKSTTHGMFSTKVTNFDELLTPEIAHKLTVGEFDKLFKTEIEEKSGVKSGQSFCKIINHYEWYVVSKFKKEEIEDLKKGSQVELRIINNSDHKVSGEITYISDEVKGNHIVVIKSTKNLNNIWTSNKVEFELIKSTKTGFKIPPSSVVEKDGVQGVYVIKDSVYKFIEIKPLLYGDNYILIKDRTTEGEPEGSNVILYDYVVVNPSNITEGDFAH